MMRVGGGYWIALVVVLALLVARLALQLPWMTSIRNSLFRRATVAERLEKYEPIVRARMDPAFQRAGIAFPPERFLLVAFKNERELHLFAAGSGQSSWSLVRTYPILAASGGLGPKLRQGDRAAEDLFVLAAEAGRGNGRVIISPVDFRVRELPASFIPPTRWTKGLCHRIARGTGRAAEPDG